MVTSDVLRSTKPSESKLSRADLLGPVLLTALVVGSMVGSGVFSLPQNMAVAAGATAIAIGWLITGIGMTGLAFVYQSLAIRMPQLDSGPYAYAKAGFGEFIGFNSAWGYWLSAWLGNVSYAVVLFGALSFFYPGFGEGNTWQAILGASIVLWIIHFLILAGVREAAIVNTITTIAKIVPVLIFIGIVAAAFNITRFRGEIAPPAEATAPVAPLGSLMAQVKSTMLVTLWAFIGIEGASVVSARAHKRSNVGFATVFGFVLCLVLYTAVSLLSLGILTQPELAQLKNPSMAGVLEHIAGSWGAGFINLAVVVSVLGAFLSWTVLAAEVPFIASRDGTMPKALSTENAKRSPALSLWITNGLVQLFLILTLWAQATYYALFTIASAAIVVPYALSGAYALKLAVSGETYRPDESRVRDILLGSIATTYGLWLVYAAGTKYLYMCAMLYAVGILVFASTRREQGKRIFRPIEAALALVLTIAGAAAAYQLWNGTLSI